MAYVLIHFVRMELYEVSDKIAKQGNEAIERYIFQDYINDPLEPLDVETRDWEIVDVAFDDKKKGE